MNPRNSFRIVSALCLLLAGWSACAAELKLAADNWPPFTSETPGSRLAADLVEHALLKANITPETEIVQWAAVLEGIKGGRYDAVIGAWRSPEREEFLAFSAPYLENRLVLVGRKDNEITFSDIKQLEGQRVGIVKGYAYGPDFADNSKIIKVESGAVVENIKALLGGDVDFILTDSLVAQAMKRQLPEHLKAKLIAYPKVVLTQSLHFAVSKNHPEAATLVKTFDQMIGELIVDGTYNRILGFDWLIVDTNADGVDEYVLGSQVPDIGSDPALSSDGYDLFATDIPLEKKRVVRYRVLNEEYNTWSEAQQAINREIDSGTLTREDTKNATSFTIGNF